MKSAIPAPPSNNFGGKTSATRPTATAPGTNAVALKNKQNE